MLYVDYISIKNGKITWIIILTSPYLYYFQYSTSTIATKILKINLRGKVEILYRCTPEEIAKNSLRPWPVTCFSLYSQYVVFPPQLGTQ